MFIKMHRVRTYLLGKFRLVWARLNSSRMTQLYFLLSVVNCIVQVALQAQAFSINNQAANFLTTLIVQGDAVESGFSVLSGHAIHFCDSVPKSLSPDSCQVIWDGTTENNTIVGGLAADMVSMSLASSSTPLTSLPISSVPASTESEVVASSSVTSLSATTVHPTPPSSASVVFSTSKKTITQTVTAFVFASPSPSSSSSSSPPVQHSSASQAEEATVTSTPEAAKGGTPVRLKRGPAEQISAVEVNGTTEVTIDGFGWNNQKVILEQSCLLSLNWPVENLDDTTKEDITFIAFQIWVLGMSLVAILNESVLHIIASLLMHVLVTAYGGFQLSQTKAFHDEFQKVITNGACNPINLLPTYWSARGDAEIASVALNAVALLLSMFISWRLFKLFGWQTFKRIGASCRIKQVYMLVLALSIAIQLSLFFIVASIALWIDQLYNGAIGQLGMQQTVYKAIFIAVLVLLLPWLTLGWVAVRHELRIPMLVFLLLSLGYLAGWAAMFASSLFRWTFVEWRFFSVMASASVFLTLATFVLGIFCLLNFQKGLKRYLSAQVPIAEDDPKYVASRSVRDSYTEKVAFPSMNGSVPSFSAAFGGNDIIVPGLPRLGPRFTNPSMDAFDPQPNPLTRPPTAKTYPTRSGSCSSYRSYDSFTSQDSQQLSRQNSSSKQGTDPRWANEKFMEAQSDDRWSIE